MQRRPSGLILASAVVSLLVGACILAPATSPGSPGSSTPTGSSVPSTSASAAADVERVEFAETADLAAPAKRELELAAAIRADAGIPALLGEDGAVAFSTLDALTAEYGRGLITELATGIDSGELLQAKSASRLDGLVASIDGNRPLVALPPSAIDVSLFANTGFTTSAVMSLLTMAIQRAAETGTGTIPRQDSRRETDSNGLLHEVELGTTIAIRTGEGTVTADVIMTATDRISNPTTGAFVALYTSRSTGHFDLNACPDVNGIAKGTYTFDSRHELNEVGGSTSVGSRAGRSASAPFQVHNGDDARLTSIDADLALAADAQGPGTSGGPGPTGPFDWNGAAGVHISMPASGSTSTTVTSANVTGAGSQAASGTMLVTSGMAQLVLGQIGREAETFWRSGKCIELVPDRDSGSVAPSESFELRVDAKSKFGGDVIDKPITATFTGKESLRPTGQPVPAPSKFQFKAGAVKDDRGTIDLMQTSNRGIGKRQVVYTVGEQDYKIEHRVGSNSYTATKCDGHAGAWTINLEAQDPLGRAIGTYTFTFPQEGGTAPVHGVLDARKDPATVHWDLTGSVTFVPATTDEPARLRFSELVGTATIKAPGVTQSVETRQQATTIDLQVGDFCH